MEKNAPFQIDGTGSATAGGSSILTALPEGIVDNLNDEQKDALAKTLGKRAWGSHPLNVRLSFPFFGTRYYLAMVGGQERRSEGRIEEERNHHPLSTAAHIFFGMGLLTLFGFAAIITMVLQSALSEY